MADLNLSSNTDSEPREVESDAASDKTMQALPQEKTSSTPLNTPEEHTPPISAGSDQPAVSTLSNSPDHANCDEGTLDLYIRDAHGAPIPNLQFLVLDKGPRLQPTVVPPEPKEVFKGKTDTSGRAPQITGLKIGTRFEIRVKKDDGEYKFAAIGSIDAMDTTACLRSPKVRFEFSTVSHQGSAGQAEKRKQDIIRSHNQIPEAKSNISRNPDIKPTIKDDRDKSGNPKVIVKDGLPNMYGQHINQALSPNAGKVDLEKVKALIEFGMEQAGWVHTSDTSAAIIEKMKSGKYQKAGTKEPNGFGASIHKCTKYVKIALWKAGYSHNNSDIAPHIAPAKDMGPALVNAGFKDITNQIPDARWAAPGDVIVYSKKSNPSAPGHIDIRTYDGYLSDFHETYLPVGVFEVTGIYRKYFDPVPEKRMRAFLKVIREWECHEESDDLRRYNLLLRPIANSRRFNDMTAHPYEKLGGNSTPAGAYQINLGTYKEQIEKYAVKAGFAPTIQDQMAISIIEATMTGRKTLGLIRRGEIERAVSQLSGRWASFPSGKHPRKGKPGQSNYMFTVEDVLTAYERNLTEIK